MHYIGILDDFYQTIQKRLQLVKQSKLYQNKNSQTGDNEHARHQNGQFSSRYNKLKKVRFITFASIDDKVFETDFSRLSLYQTTDANLNRKNLSVLFLPKVNKQWD